jgi:predicted nucleotidyltransferase
MLSFESMSRVDASIDAIERALDEVLAAIPSVQVAYLFGSRARGTSRPDSDLDLAIALPREMPDAERGRVKLQVIDGLTARLGSLGERADIVDLDRAGSSVAFAAIAQGRCVYTRDRAERVRLEVRIARRYDDERPYRELTAAAARRAAERMRVGSHG